MAWSPSAMPWVGSQARAGGTPASTHTAWRWRERGSVRWRLWPAELQRADAVRDVGGDYRKRVDLAWLDGILAVTKADAGGLARAPGTAGG